MARIYGEIQASGLMTFDKSFSRSNGQPLDSTEVFYSLVAARDYAKTDVAYVGQKIVVVETVDEVTTVTHYSIEADHSLKELGAIPVGDGLTVEVVNGKIQLAALEGHTSGTYQPFLVDGKIEWREPSATTVEGLDGRLTTAEEDIDALEGLVGHEASDGVEASGLVKAVADNADAIAAVEDKIGEVAEGKTVVDMISDAQTAATYDDTKIKEDIKTNADAIGVIEADYLKATDKEDLQTQINTIMNNPDTEGVINSINEFTQYIADHGEIAEGFRTDIDANAKAISDHETAAAQTYETKTDASAKLTEAKEYADGLNTAMDDRMQDVEEAAHSHDNKDVIDDITAEQVTAWNAAEQNAKNYADGLKAEVDTALEGKVAVEEGKSLIAGTLISKLEGISEGAQVNAIDTVDDTQFGLENKHLTLLNIAIDKVTGLQDILDDKAGKGTTLAEYGITDAYTKTETETRLQEVIDGLSDTSETAASVAQSLETYKTSNDQRVSTIESELANKVEAEKDKSLISDTLIAKLEAIEAEAQVNKIEVVKVGETLLEIVDKTVVIPVGAGLKASEEIIIAEDGTLGVGEVNVNKLVQTDGEYLIMNGGSATLQ